MKKMGEGVNGKLRSRVGSCALQPLAKLGRMGYALGFITNLNVSLVLCTALPVVYQYVLALRCQARSSTTCAMLAHYWSWPWSTGPCHEWWGGDSLP